MIRILHVVEYFWAAGLETLVRDMALLRDRRTVPHASICTLNNNNGWCEDILKEKGVRVWGLRWKDMGKSTVQLSHEIYRIIRKEKINIIHAHNFVSFFVSAPVALLSGVRLVVTFHGFPEWRLYSKLSYPFLYMCADKTVIVAEAMRSHYAMPFCRSKIMNIMNGIDIKQFSMDSHHLKKTDIGLNEDDFVIGSVGRLSPMKNQSMQIRACKFLKDKIPNLKLIMITGDSPDSEGLAEQLRALADELGVKDNVVFLGFRSDVSQVLGIMDVFVMTSFSEGTSLALLEAMAVGLPSVVSDVGGNSDVVSHNKNGLLFDVKDQESFNRHILNLYEHTEERKRIGAEAAQSVSRYSIENMIRNYEALYSEILSCQN